MCIGECIDSVICRVYSNLGISLANDASMDVLYPISERFVARDERLRILTRQQNQGLGQACNTGVRAATENWLLLLDFDDFRATPRAISALVERFAHLAHRGPVNTSVIVRSQRREGSVLPQIRKAMHTEHADKNRPNDVSRRMIGCAFTVLNTLGTRFLGKVYGNALAFELRSAGLSIVQWCGATVYDRRVAHGLQITLNHPRVLCASPCFICVGFFLALLCQKRGADRGHMPSQLPEPPPEHPQPVRIDAQGSRPAFVTLLSGDGDDHGPATCLWHRCSRPRQSGRTGKEPQTNNPQRCTRSAYQDPCAHIPQPVANDVIP